jgi:lipid-binding SYLF domain-containing protein
MKNKTYSLIYVAAVIFLGLSGLAVSAQTTPPPTPDPKIEKKRAEVRKMSADTLKRLYKVQPLARTSVENAFGYAVFSNTGVKILVSGSGKGYGVAVSNKAKKEVFMKMLELQAGLGFGVKKFKVIFVFDTEKAFNKFVDSGWEFGGQSDAAAKAGEGKGASVAGAVSVSDGVWMYQLTDKGLALEITLKGSKYYKDDELNK